MNEPIISRRNNWVCLKFPDRTKNIWIKAEEFSQLAEEIRVPDSSALDELEALEEVLAPMPKSGAVSVAYLREYIARRKQARKLVRGRK